MHNIVILGGNFAGLSTAHYLLRHVLPLLNDSTKSEKPAYKVTFVSPSSHTFFNIAAPRALISAEVVSLDKSFFSIAEGFSQYDQKQFEFVQGKATLVDETSRIVSVSGPDDSPITSVQYDSLIIATGTTSPSPLWTLHGAHTNTEAAFKDMHRRLPKAKTVLVVGGGPTGVETAGEIGHFYKDKDITLLSGSTRLLPGLSHPNVGKSAEKQLEALNVKVLHSIKVVSATELPSGETSVSLSDGTTRTVDIYINGISGGPNTSFLPSSWLAESNQVATDGSTLRATKAPGGIYSIGDAASYSTGGIMDAKFPVPALCYSIYSDLREAAEGGAGEKAPLKETVYKQMKSQVQFVPIGPTGGVGVAFGFSIPSFIIWLVKSRTFFLDKAHEVATGAGFAKP